VHPVLGGVQEGFWLGPSVLDHVTPQMSCYTDEIFGPVLSVLRAPSYETAVDLVNGSPYGNGVGTALQVVSVSERSGTLVILLAREFDLLSPPAAAAGASPAMGPRRSGTAGSSASRRCAPVWPRRNGSLMPGG
jgi:hypothetical protein